MAQEISDLGVDLWIRHVLVPDLTDDEKGLADLKHFYRWTKKQLRE